MLTNAVALRIEYWPIERLNRISPQSAKKRRCSRCYFLGSSFPKLAAR